MRKKIFCLLFAAFVNITAKASLGKIKKEVESGKKGSFSGQQLEQIQQIVHDYILENPGVIVEAKNKLQAQKEKELIEKIKLNAAKYKKQIFSTQAPGRIVTGNPDGKIIIAEFTQHQCYLCQTVKPFVAKLLTNNPETQLITIYWPFLNNDAIYAAKAVLAAQKQNKSTELNEKMIASHDPLTKEKIDSIIQSTPGIDVEKLRIDMQDKKIDKGLQENFKLAANLELAGTPTIIFTNKEMTKFSLIPGQTPNLDKDLNQALNEVR